MTSESILKPKCVFPIFIFKSPRLPRDLKRLVVLKRQLFPFVFVKNSKYFYKNRADVRISAGLPSAWRGGRGGLL